MKAIFERRSVRTYLNKKVEEEKIEKLLRAAMAAPSAGNQQPWEFYVVTDPKTLEELSGASPYSICVKNAPLAIIPCYRKEGKYTECIPLDMSATTENILLEAEYLELGAVWLAVTPMPDRMEKVRSVLKLSEDMEAFAIISCGYPAREKKEREERFDRERVHYIG